MAGAVIRRIAIRGERRVVSRSAPRSRLVRMDASEVFEALRPRLLGVAYRILGSVTDAEDVLQDAWVRWSRTDVDSVLNPEAYLVTVVGRQAQTCLAPRLILRSCEITPSSATTR